MDAYMVHVPLHVSGLILHGAFQTKFLGILYHKLSTFMVIRRGTGSFKCYFWIFEQLSWFWTWWAPYYGIMVRAFTRISLLSFGILSNPFNWRKVLSGAKRCHLVWLDIWYEHWEIKGGKFEFWPILHTGRFSHFWPSWVWLILTQGGNDIICTGTKAVCRWN